MTNNEILDAFFTVEIFFSFVELQIGQCGILFCDGFDVRLGGIAFPILGFM